MVRRDALTAFGAAALGMAAGSSSHAADHESGDAPKSPIQDFHTYLCAYHIIKKLPGIVIDAHHYCSQVADEVHQCVIFDKSGQGAKLIGVEYIVSDRLYRTFPDAEKKFYHPHSYEVTGGLLIAPGMKPADEYKLMEGLVTTWGKTWHTWPDPATTVPMGPPVLMWAATRDGQISAETLAGRDKTFNVSTSDLRRVRSPIGPIPQIDAPKNEDEVGRQWTNGGPDVKSPR